MADNPLYPVLAKLASALGITVDRLWPQLVAVTFYQSLYWAIFNPILVFVSTILMVLYTRWYRRSDSQGDDWVTILFIGSWILYPIVVLVIVLGYPDMLAGVFAPEAVTAKELLHQLSGK